MKQYSIGIDCRFWGVSHAGLGRYTRELVFKIIANKPENLNLTLFFRKGEWKQDENLLKGVTIVEADAPHYSIWQEQVELPKIIDRENLDLIHFTHFNVPVTLKTPYIVTIHDLIKHFFKGKPVTTHSLPVYWLKYGGYRLVIGNAIAKARRIIVPSFFTKDQVTVHYPGSESKIHVIYEGVSEAFLRPKKTINQAQIPNEPYFTYTGSAYPSKNIPVLLQALQNLVGKGYAVKLVMACGRNYFWSKLEEEVKKKNLSHHVILPGALDDASLVALYKKTLAFVQPSLMEGFGLPALEAMACGAPVISSSTGSLPEVYGDSAEYFHPQDPEALTDHMEAALRLSSDQRQVIVHKGKKHAALFTWEKAARETIRVYEAAYH